MRKFVAIYKRVPQANAIEPIVYLDQTTKHDDSTLEQIFNHYKQLKTDLKALLEFHISKDEFWSEWRLTVIAATVRIALVDILDLSEVDIPAGVFLHPAVGWG